MFVFVTNRDNHDRIHDTFKEKRRRVFLFSIYSLSDSFANKMGSNNLFRINKVAPVAARVNISTAMKTEIGSNTSFPPKAK